MMSDNLGAIFPSARMVFAGIHLDSYQMCAIISTLVILPTVWLRNLSLLSYISGFNHYIVPQNVLKISSKLFDLC